MIKAMVGRAGHVSALALTYTVSLSCCYAAIPPCHAMDRLQPSLCIDCFFGGCTDFAPS